MSLPILPHDDDMVRRRPPHSAWLSLQVLTMPRGPQIGSQDILPGAREEAPGTSIWEGGSSRSKGADAPPRDVSSCWPWAGMTPGPSWTPSRIRLPGVAMGTHFSAVSGTGLARYRHGRLWEGGAESRPVGAAESGLSNAACRGPGAAGEGAPSTPSRRAAPPPLSPPST